MRIPTATYRVQFNQESPFERASGAVPYLHALGVSDLYSSPIYAARRGSGHGYDVVAHEQINPELGGEPAFRELAKGLAAHEMGLLLDIVPNHMCIAIGENRHWQDVLTHGPSSTSR